MSNSEEEEIARDYICFGNPDATVVVVDATCLERNLNLVFQIMEITNNVIVCVNLLDEAKKKRIRINLNKLQSLLGVPVVGTIACKKHTLKHLEQIISKVCKGEIIPEPKLVQYSPQIEECVKELQAICDINYCDARVVCCSPSFSAGSLLCCSSSFLAGSLLSSSLFVSLVESICFISMFCFS